MCKWENHNFTIRKKKQSTKPLGSENEQEVYRCTTYSDQKDATPFLSHMFTGISQEHG